MTIGINVLTEGSVRVQWLNNGMIFILEQVKELVDTTTPTNTDEVMKSMINNLTCWESCTLRPSEVKAVVEWKGGDGVIFEVDEVRAGLFPHRNKVSATLHNGIVLIRDNLYDGTHEYVINKPIQVPFSLFPRILEETCKVRDEYERNIKIAPLVGMNVREEESGVLP